MNSPRRDLPAFQSSLLQLLSIKDIKKKRISPFKSLNHFTLQSYRDWTKASLYMRLFIWNQDSQKPEQSSLVKGIAEST